MIRATSSVSFLILALTLASLVGCNRRSPLGAPGTPGASSGAAGSTTPGEASASTEAGTPASRRPPTGTSCAGRDDCPSDQVCVEHGCRYRETSVAGEILAAAAAAQVEAGDWQGAMRAYDDAIAAFDTARRPVPPDIYCASAVLLLRTSADGEGRERGARRADQCFRASLPGFEPREEVTRALSRLRFEGLDSALFDRVDPAERFFTAEATRPTLDALTISVVVPDDVENAPGLDGVRTALTEEAARRAIGECFEQDWETRHERTAHASLVLRYTTRLHDMGDYDSYDPELTFERMTVAEDGFEPCLAQALSNVIPPPRTGRVVTWQTSVEIDARVE
jgi:hypothetical protein